MTATEGTSCLSFEQTSPEKKISRMSDVDFWKRHCPKKSWIFNYPYAVGKIDIGEKGVGALF